MNISYTIYTYIVFFDIKHLPGTFFYSNFSTGADTNEEAMLARALQMSVEGGEESEAPAPATPAPAAAPAPADAGEDLGMMTEEQQIEYAMRLSMQASAGKSIDRWNHRKVNKNTNSAIQNPLIWNHSREISRISLYVCLNCYISRGWGWV